MTRSVPNLEAHPLRAMLDAGLRCTLGSDDPSMFHSYVTNEYELARGAFGFDDLRLAEVARNGVVASFAELEMKAEIEAGIDAWLESSTREGARDNDDSRL